MTAELFLNDHQRFLKVDGESSFSQKIPREHLPGDYLHLCFTNNGSEKLILSWYIHPDAETFQNNIIEDVNKADGSQGELQAAREASANLAKITEEFKGLISQLNDFRTSMQIEEFSIYSATDLSGLESKLWNTSLFSLIMAPVLFFLLYHVVKYIINNADKKD